MVLCRAATQRCKTFKLVRPSKASTKIASGALVLHQSKWAVYNRRQNVWWSKLKKWIGGVPARWLRARLHNRRVRRKREREQERWQYREAQAWWVLASEETSSNVDFTACCTYVPKEREWGGEFVRFATTFDTLSQINGIVESSVIDGWKWMDRHNDINVIGGKSMAVVGTVVVPGWALAMGVKYRM